jgi:hypothetical protein
MTKPVVTNRERDGQAMFGTMPVLAAAWRAA